MVTTQEGGLTLQVDPLLDLAACKTNFGVDCHQKGILPVYFMATNGNPGASYRIVAREIWFGAGDHHNLHAKSGLLETNTAAASSSLAVAGFGLAFVTGGPAGVFIASAGMKAIDDEESIRENFVIKQFQNVTLLPGKSAAGFIYYGQADPISINALPFINVPVQNLETRQTNTFSISLTRAPDSTSSMPDDKTAPRPARLGIP
jgi:hypothetical protein